MLQTAYIFRKFHANLKNIFFNFALCIVYCVIFVETKHNMTHLTTYQMFQYQRYGNILIDGSRSTTNPYDPALLPKNYDYEDDDYTFTRWVENNAELELLKNEVYED
jgi:hypothetical protein